MILYKEINLPAIPEELLAKDLTANDLVANIGYGIEHIKNNKKLTACDYKSGVLTDPDLIKWLQTNIEGLENSIALVQSQSHGTHIVHSDVSRIYALNYMIELGGSPVTSWYREHDKPISRRKFKGLQQAEDGPVKYDDLETLTSVVFEKHKWYLIATDVLHDVDNIDGHRKSISIGIQSANSKLFQFIEKLYV